MLQRRLLRVMQIRHQRPRRPQSFRHTIGVTKSRERRHPIMRLQRLRRVMPIQLPRRPRGQCRPYLQPQFRQPPRHPAAHLRPIRRLSKQNLLGPQPGQFRGTLRKRPLKRQKLPR